MDQGTIDSRPGGTREKTADQGIMAVIGVLGAVVAIPATFFLAWGFHEWFTRMDCSAETWWGSGCYEGELGITAVAFGILYLPFFIPSLAMALRDRRGGVGNWWPFLVLCAVPAAILVIASVWFVVNSGHS